MTADRRATRHIFAILRAVKLERQERLAVYTFLTCRDITSTNDLTAAELTTVAGALFSWEKSGHLDMKLAEILGVRKAS